MPRRLASGESIRVEESPERHLEEDAVLQLAEGGAVEGAVEAVQRVAPDQGVDAVDRAVAEDRAEQLGGLRRLVGLGAGEAEVVLGLPELAEPLEVVDEQVDRRGVGAAARRGGARPRRRPRRRSTRPGPTRPAGPSMRQGDRASRARSPARGSSDGVPSSRTNRESGRWAARLRIEVAIRPTAASSFWPTISRWEPAWPAEGHRRRRLDRDRLAEPGRRRPSAAGRDRRRRRAAPSAARCWPASGEALPSKTIGGRTRTPRSRVELGDLAGGSPRGCSSGSQTTWKMLLPSSRPLASL